MTINELILDVLAIITTGLTARGFTGGNALVVKQNFQPTNQGVPSQRSVFLYKMDDVMVGHMGRSDRWVTPEAPAQPYMEHTERQWIESAFQISVLAIQNPATPELPTALEIANIVRGIMQSDYAINTLRAKGVGILRVAQVRNPYFVDDKNRFEASPSFDFTLTHEQVIISTSNVVESIEYNIQRV